MEVAKNIRKFRKQNNLLQKELAYKAGVSSQVISNWERGYTSPNYEDIIKLSDALGCSTDDLLGKKNNKKHFEDAEAIMFKDFKGFENLPEDKQEEIKKAINDQIEYLIYKERRDN